MRFNGAINDMNILTHFAKIIAIISKQAKYLVMKLTPVHIYLIAEDHANQSAFKCYAEIPQQVLFSRYNLVGLGTSGIIFLRMRSESLYSPLRSCNLSKCRALKIKLTAIPGISMDFEQEFATRRLQFDIDVEVITRKFWPKYDEPLLQPSDIRVILPPVNTIRKILDCSKQANDFICLEIQGNMMTLIIENDDAVLKSSLELETESRILDTGKVRISLKRFHNFLKSIDIRSGIKIYFDVSDENIGIFSFLLDGMSLQFVLPHCMR